MDIDKQNFKQKNEKEKVLYKKPVGKIMMGSFLGGLAGLI